MLIYVASPYSDPDPAVREQRFRAVCAYTAMLTAQGVHAFSPIAHSHPLVEFGAATSWEFWRDFDTKILSRCDELYALCLDGWQLSVGMAAEIEIARSLCMPISYVQP